MPSGSIRPASSGNSMAPKHHPFAVFGINNRNRVVNKRLRLTNKVNGADWHGKCRFDSPNIVFTVYRIACGYEDCDDLDVLRFDPVSNIALIAPRFAGMAHCAAT